MTWRLVVATVVLGGLAAPPAVADRGQLPDLSGYTAVDSANYTTYYDYPTTGGVQFVTLSGIRCRITYTGRANPPFKAAMCWGHLPGTPSNFVAVQAGLEFPPASFSEGDLTAVEQYREPPGDKSPRTISPDAYKPLPAGSKVSYRDSATCAVADALIVCLLGEHGFVLELQGSQAF